MGYRFEYDTEPERFAAAVLDAFDLFIKVVGTESNVGRRME